MEGALAGWWNQLLLCGQRRQLTVDVLFGLQWMPLGDGATGVGQHVRPMLQTQAGCFATHKDLPDGIILSDLVVVKHSDGHQDFLQDQQERTN